MFPTQTDNAVPFWVPARFLLTGALALLIVWTTLAFNPQLLLGSYAAPEVLALVHSLTLGFATMTLVGAMHQMIPVLLVTKLHAPRLGTLTYGLLLLGAGSVIAGFALGYQVTFLALGGSLILLGLLIFDYNLWRTVRAAQTRDAVGHAMLAAAGYLSLTVTLGLLIALSRLSPGLVAALGYITPLHLCLGLFGAFFLAIAGAGHKLLGMFVLTHGISQRRLRTTIWLVHAALLVLVIHSFSGLNLWPVAAGLLILAAVFFALDMRRILAKRMRRQLELPIRHFLLAPAFLAVAAVLAVLGYYPAAIFSLLGGFITLAIVGMLIKILSFLTWQYRYGARIGKEKIPMMRDMTLSRVGWLFYGFALGALLIVSSLLWPVSLLAASGSLLMALAAWGLLLQMLWIIFAPHQPQPSTQTSKQPI